MRYGTLIRLPQMTDKEYDELLKECRRHQVSGTEVKAMPGTDRGILLASDEQGVLEGVFHRVATSIPKKYQYCTVERMLNVP